MRQNNSTRNRKDHISKLAQPKLLNIDDYSVAPNGKLIKQKKEKKRRNYRRDLMHVVETEPSRPREGYVSGSPYLTRVPTNASGLKEPSISTSRRRHGKRSKRKSKARQMLRALDSMSQYEANGPMQT